MVLCKNKKLYDYFKICSYHLACSTFTLAFFKTLPQTDHMLLLQVSNPPGLVRLGSHICNRVLKCCFSLLKNKNKNTPWWRFSSSLRGWILYLCFVGGWVTLIPCFSKSKIPATVEMSHFVLPVKTFCRVFSRLFLHKFASQPMWSAGMFIFWTVCICDCLIIQSLWLFM